MGKQINGNLNRLVISILHNIFFCVQKEKKCIQVRKNINVSKWQQNFPFWIDMDENEAPSDRLTVFKMAHTV